MAWSKLTPLLRRLAAAADPDGVVSSESISLDPRTQALVRIGAAVCGTSLASGIADLVAEARRTGATEQEVLGVFLCVGPLAGEPRIVAATPRVAVGLGYDLDRAFEHG